MCIAILVLLRFSPFQFNASFLAMYVTYKNVYQVIAIIVLLSLECNHLASSLVNAWWLFFCFQLKQYVFRIFPCFHKFVDNSLYSLRASHRNQYNRTCCRHFSWLVQKQWIIKRSWMPHYTGIRHCRIILPLWKQARWFFHIYSSFYQRIKSGERTPKGNPQPVMFSMNVL